MALLQISPEARSTAAGEEPRTGTGDRGNGDTRREFRFEKRHFEQIAALLYRLAGISLAPHKVEMVYSRLARRLRELRVADFDAYCALIESDEGAGEIGFLVNALTTNLTAFFREPHHFEHLAKVVLPQIRERQSSHSKPRLRIWSAGCSSGQEPYTLSMVLNANLPDLRRWDARILATDIDTHMVETARRGIYSGDQATGIPGPLRDRYTRKVADGHEHRLAMSEELRHLITFKALNLMEAWPMKGPFDAIFCRNVLIYFDRIGRTQVIEKFAQLLCPQGFLYLGHSESLYGVSGAFHQAGPTIYRRDS